MNISRKLREMLSTMLGEKNAIGRLAIRRVPKDSLAFCTLELDLSALAFDTFHLQIGKRGYSDSLQYVTDSSFFTGRI